MSALLRILRGDGSSERVVTLNEQVLGPLEHEVNEFVIKCGHHVLNTRLGIYRGNARAINAKDGAVLEYIVLADPDAPLPIVQGGFVRLEPLGATNAEQFTPTDLRQVPQVRGAGDGHDGSATS